MIKAISYGSNKNVIHTSHLYLSLLVYPLKWWRISTTQDEQIEIDLSKFVDIKRIEIRENDIAYACILAKEKP